MDAKVRKPDPDVLAARIAARQHGVISLAQLERIGIHRQGRRMRLNRGRLHRIHRGVFAWGHCGLSREGHWVAAVLAVGRGAVLSHESAGLLWGMLGSQGGKSAQVALPIHVTVSGHGESRRGIRVHRSGTLAPDQTTRRRGIPVTTPSRTLRDLRRILPQPQFDRALRQAEYLRLPLEDSLEPDHTRSELEARFLALCRGHRLPRPEVNVRVADYVVDFLWRDPHLIAELDGYRTHGGRAAFEADRARDVHLRLLGFSVVRFTWRQLTSERARTGATLRTLLSRAA